jgi:hypothetical protein
MNDHLHNFRFGPRAGVNSALVITFLAIFVSLGLNTGLRSSSGESLEEARNAAGKGVLGANSKTETSPCPENKPTIGYIDLNGKKQIVFSLEKTQKASVCFADEKEANQAGYYRN